MGGGDGNSVLFPGLLVGNSVLFPEPVGVMSLSPMVGSSVEFPMVGARVRLVDASVGAIVGEVVLGAVVALVGGVVGGGRGERVGGAVTGAAVGTAMGLAKTFLSCGSSSYRVVSASSVSSTLSCSPGNSNSLTMDGCPNRRFNVLKMPSPRQDPKASNSKYSCRLVIILPTVYCVFLRQGQLGKGDEWLGGC